MQVLSYFPKLVFLKTGILKKFCHKIFTNVLLSWMFWHSFGLAFCVLCHTTCFTVSKCKSFDRLLLENIYFVAYYASPHRFMTRSIYALGTSIYALKWMGFKFC